MDTLPVSTTNVHCVYGFSDIYFRRYCLELDQQVSKGLPLASPAPQPSRLADQHRKSAVALQTASLWLRAAGCLVSADYSKRVLWMFASDPKFSVIGTADPSITQDEGDRIIVRGIALRKQVFAQIQAPKLLRFALRDLIPKSSTGDSSSSNFSGDGPLSSRNINLKAVTKNEQKSETATPEAEKIDMQRQRIREILEHHQDIYKHFITSIISAICLRLTKQGRFIPLNGRSLIWLKPPAEGNSDLEDDASLDEIPQSETLLSLDVGLTTTGSVVISYRVSHEPNLRFWVPGLDNENRFRRQEKLNIWLASSGAVARLPESDAADKSNSSSKQVSPTKSIAPVAQDTDAKMMAWRNLVKHWLVMHGIDKSHIDEGSWVEVEILEQHVENAQLRRIWWPASLCVYRRATETKIADDEISTWFNSADNNGDFLTFAEEWLASASARQELLDKRAAEKANQQAADVHTERSRMAEGPPRDHEHTDSIDGFARTPNYLDLPAGNTMYPTPPHGIQPQRPSASSLNEPTAGMPTDGDEGMKDMHRMESLDGSMDIMDEHNILMARNDSSMATGMYDASDGEELFGEIGGGQFDAKGGLTEADFNFFDDEPNLDNIDSADITMGDHDQVVPDEAATAQVSTQNETEDLGLGREIIAAQEQPVSKQDDIRDPPESNEETRVEQAAEGADQSGSFETPAEQKLPFSVTNSIPASPPLSPYEVKRKIFSQNMPPPWSRKDLNLKRRSSAFDPVEFGDTLNLSDRKYGADGKFSVQENGIKPDTSQTELAKTAAEIPTIGPQKQTKGAPLGLKIDPPLLTAYLSQPASGADRLDSTAMTQTVSNHDDSSESPLSDSERGEFTVSMRGVKRKRPAVSPIKDSPTILTGTNASPITSNGPDDPDHYILSRLSPRVAEGSFDGYFSVAENATTGTLPVSQENFAQISQIFLDQISQTSLDHPLDDVPLRQSCDLRSLSQEFADSIQSVFGDGLSRELQQYAKLEDRFPKAEDDSVNSQPQPEPKGFAEPPSGDIFKLLPPYIRLRRAKNSLEILPPVLYFWETFGLGPHSGPKNVVPVCIYPPTENAREGASAFLDRIGDVYQSCGLGTHARSVAPEKGLVSWAVASQSNPTIAQVMVGLRKVCENIGAILAKKPPKRLNFVIYIVNPFTQGGAIADICGAFYSLFEKYLQGLDPEQKTPNELVLQIVPISFLISPASLVVPLQSEYLKLALEVYDRCPPSPNDRKTTSLIQYGPALVLAKTIPKTIEFQRTAHSRSSLMPEGSFLHLAYAQSLDGRWISAAWIDSAGSFQTSLAYCLQGKGSLTCRSLADVLRDIWETTCEVMQAEQTEWHLMLVKEGVMTEEEIEIWNTLSSQSERPKRSCFILTLLTATTNPSLSIFPASPNIPTVLASQHGCGLFTTPVSTPQPSTYSPDASAGGAQPATPAAAASTPNESATFDIDSDAVLADASDESWGVILSYRTNNSLALTELRPALGSGYLVKRKGAIEQDGYGVLGLNVIRVDKEKDRDKEKEKEKGRVEIVLRDALREFRRLSILTKAKGMISAHQPEEGTWPWHVATVVKGVRRLSCVF